ncbi:hypothetical protein [Dactylococcopsis salina]|uniref:Uncharacterized protein n=1 Tax=Dactylococcopsis salina (strain PCC 8305) TaxID=13035 RepID=K9YVS5_DACS8|nr:hypothetical protein [Dactylococcopsis salina]AFZ50622.1 hypothetical protein Dacsa_1974 [Dactylococcopsis salina PCC 8305]
MNQQSVLGTSLVFSHSLTNVAANAVGVAKTGTAIGSLHRSRVLVLPKGF